MQKLKVGDRVRLVHKVVKEDGWVNCWSADMDRLLREKAGVDLEVTGIYSHGVYFVVDHHGWPHGAFDLIKDEVKVVAKVSMDKKYQTRDGRPVRLLCIDAVSSNYPVIALVPNSHSRDEHDASCFTPEGRFFVSGENSKDLIEVPPYADFKIDDPIMVWDHSEEGAIRRHFAGVDGDHVLAFADGCTSFSQGSYGTMTWGHARRPTAEELAVTR